VATKYPMTVTQITDVCWHVTSESNPDADPYIVKSVDGQLSCDCPATLYSGDQCKHARLVATTVVAEKTAAAEARIWQRKVDALTLMMGSREAAEKVLREMA
jgi:hypothetical protein